MGRFGQPRYKDPSGTPPALRGIREVTDKNKHILLEAVFNGEFIPDHLLPVGIHRCGQAKWRAHLCTVGHKFSGPPRDNVRDACEDRRRFCEENGVNFVLYGKQTHAKGPIGSRPAVSSGFPRLSDYVSTMSRGAGGGAKDSQAVLGMVSNNPQIKAFLNAIEDAKRMMHARKAEEQGTASYHVSRSHAELHKKIVEQYIDQSQHVYERIRASSATPQNEPVDEGGVSGRFYLCPIRLQPAPGVLIRFLWNVNTPVEDRSLFTYLDSILVNANPPMNAFEREAFIESLISGDVKNQVTSFIKLNERIDELMDEHESFTAAIKAVHHGAPHVVATRKAAHNVAAVNAPISADPADPMMELDLAPGLLVSWNALTPDDIAEQFSVQCENEQDVVTAGDILFTIVDRAVRQRQTLFYGPQGMPKKSTASQPPAHAPLEMGLNVSESDIETMENNIALFSDSTIRQCFRV